MKRLSESIRSCLDAVGANDESSRKARRAAEVQQAWKLAVEKVYQDAAPFVLSHINAIYVLKENGVACVVVYADDSLIRSDIDARQEFLKMALAELGERVETFRILASRFTMKDRHPFAETSAEDDEYDPSRIFEKTRRTPISDEEQARVDACVEPIEDERVRNALKRAMIAEIEHHGENRHFS